MVAVRVGFCCCCFCDNCLRSSIYFFKSLITDAEEPFAGVFVFFFVDDDFLTSLTSSSSPSSSSSLKYTSSEPFSASSSTRCRWRPDADNFVCLLFVEVEWEWE